MISIKEKNIYHLLDMQKASNTLDKRIVITHSKTGEPLSYFDDNIWNFTYEIPLNTRVRELCFEASCFPNYEFLYEVKRIILLHLSRPRKHQRNRTIGSTSNILATLKFIGLFLQENRKSIYRFKDFFTKNNLVYKFISTHVFKSQTVHLKTLINFLNSMSAKHRGFPFISQDILSYIDKRILEFPPTQQHYVIPNRINNILLTNMINDVEYLYKKLNDIESLLMRTYTEPGYFMPIKRQKELLKDNNKNLSPPQKAITESNLKDLANKFNINSFENLNSFIGAIQGLCKTLILSQSGMRTDDFNSITYGENGNCVEYQKYDDNLIPIVWGYSKKYMGETTKVPWVIGKDCIKAIDILQMIVRVVFAASRNKEHIISLSFTKIEDVPLAINSLTLKGFVTGAMNKNKYAVFFNEKPHQNKFISKYDLTLMLEDIEELNQYNPEYDEQQVKTGSQWKLKYHQLRRTLAVLAVESGVVHKTSLMRQLKHLTLVLTEYYSQNSRTNPFFTENNDTSVTGVKTELQVNGIIALFQENKILGGQGVGMLHSIWVEYKDDQDTARKRLKRKIHNGELSYSDGPCGGCLSSTECDSRIQGQYIPCLTCSEALHSINNLQNLLEVLKIEQDSIPQDDAGRKYIQQEIDSIKRAIKKVKKEPK